MLKYFTGIYCLLLMGSSLGQQISPNQEPDTTEEPAQTEQQLAPIQVTASRLATTTNDSVRAVTVVNRADIQNKPNALLPDLLRNETGVYIQQTTPGQGIPIIRGLKGSQNLHLVDGMRVNTAFFRNAPNQYFALIDSFMIDQIDVVRGPGSVLYGGDALGGVVNVITHSPVFVGSQWQTTGQLAGIYNSADEQWLSHVNVDSGNETLATTLGLSYQDIGQRTTGSGETIPFTAYTARSANNKWVYQPNDEHRLLFDVQYLRQPATPRVDDLVAGFGQTEPDSRVFLFTPNERYFAHINYQSSQATAWYDNADWHLAWQKIVDGRLKQGLNSTTITTEQNASELWGWQMDFDKSLGVGQWVYGFETYQDTISSAKQQSQNGSTVHKDPRFPDQSVMRHWAVYTDYHHPIGQHQLSIGARYSDYDIDLNSPEISEDGLRLSDVTWQLGWLYQLNDADRLFANLSRGFRPPNIFDLGQVGDRPNNRFNVVNVDVKPESVHTLDIGYKHAGNGWQAETVLFVSDYKDVIASSLTGETTDSGREIVQSQNIGEVQIWGLEAQYNRYLNHGGHLYAHLTYTYGKQREAGEHEPADRIPPAFGVIGYHWPISQTLTWRQQARYASHQNRLSARDVRDARINPLGTGGFVVYDSHLTWQAGIQTTMRVGIENLFDKKYREHASGLDAAGRNYHVSIFYEF
ncbi:MAG: TonB-dependent receptor [Proteobacteria bacterium]|nr:MAG: TonB-dependent receptor [Pseudomonadota bacterium]